jgi:pyridoxal phosphate-dependent aminotransferase EpsN
MSKVPRIYLSSPHLGTQEFEFVREAFATNWIAPLGPHVDAFEKEFGQILQEGTELTEIGRKEAQKAQESEGDGLTTEGESRRTEDGERMADGGQRIGRKEAQKAQESEGDGLTTEGGGQSSVLHAAALSSGTAALHLALKLVGLQRGEEVFCSSLTFSASANPIVYEGAKPVFIDSERASWNMDPALLEKALEDRKKKGKLPRAVILVHLYGQCADIDTIMAVCNRFGVAVIEDAAEALGAIYFSHKKAQEAQKKTEWETQESGMAASAKSTAGHSSPFTRHSICPGTVGKLGIFSFNGNKIITTSGGGMLVSNDESLIKKARFWATQSRDPAPHYQHSEIGYNYRMSNVLAGIGRGQLQVLADRVNARRANCVFYEKAFADLAGVSFMPEAPWNRCTRWLTCILVDPKQFGVDREAIRLALEAENIEARPVWKPMHLQPVFADCDRFGGEVAEDLFNRGLCLPSGSNLSEADLARVVAVVRKCRK